FGADSLFMRETPGSAGGPPQVRLLQRPTLKPLSPRERGWGEGSARTRDPAPIEPSSGPPTKAFGGRLYGPPRIKSGAGSSHPRGDFFQSPEGEGRASAIFIWHMV